MRDIRGRMGQGGMREGAISSRCNEKHPHTKKRCSKKQRHHEDHTDYFGNSWTNTIGKDQIAPESDRSYLPD